MSPGDLFFEPFFSAPRRRVSAIQGIRVLPLYSCRLSRLLRMVLLEEVIRYAALGPIFETIFFFPIFLFFPRDSDAGGIQWGARSKFSFREESFRGRVSGEGLCGYSLGTHLSPLLWGWIFFPLFLFFLPSFPCTCLAADLWVSCGCFYFFDRGDICLHCSYGLTLFSWLVCLGWLVPVPMKISPRVWGFKIFWTFSTEIALCSFIPHEEYSDGMPTIIWFLISISDQTFKSLYTYVL